MAVSGPQQHAFRSGLSLHAMSPKAGAVMSEQMERRLTRRTMIWKVQAFGPIRKQIAFRWHFSRDELNHDNISVITAMSSIASCAGFGSLCSGDAKTSAHGYRSICITTCGFGSDAHSAYNLFGMHGSDDIAQALRHAMKMRSSNQSQPARPGF